MQRIAGNELLYDEKPFAKKRKKNCTGGRLETEISQVDSEGFSSYILLGALKPTENETNNERKTY